MKQKFKFLLLLAVVATLFVNCEKEDINSYENNNSLKISSRKATVNEVLHKINSSSIKQKIVYENNRIVEKNNDINANQNLRINSQDSIFIVIEKENDFTTYLLPISSYTTENPFFLKYIITVDVNNIEKSGYIKYIPSTPTGILNLGTFSGIVEVYNIEDELIGLTTFVNGTAQPQTSNSHNRVICYDQVTINEVTCSHGGGHGVGESCEEGFINDAYWYVSITTVCNYDPTTIVQIIDDSSNPSMGGGSSNLNPNTTTLNKIINNLTMAQIDWWYSQNTSQATRDAIVNYVKQNNTNEDDFNEAMEFVKELIDLAIAEPNQDDVNNLVNLTILIEESDNLFFTEEFAESLVQYTDLDISTLPPDYPLPFLSLKTFFNYRKLRQLNPEWSRAKCIWHATKEIVHISLDAFGLIPVVGEVADLTNGLIYAIEGDTINATLSVASAIPFVGYGSTATKYGVKIINSASTVTTKVKLVWKVTANGIEFGSSSQLRKVLGLAVGNSNQAHHILPWAWRNHSVIQKAAKSGSAFHMNEALNGIAVAAWRNQPNHNAYNNLIKSKLDALPSNLTPSQAYTQLTNILNQARQAIINNPNTHLNDLTF